jgi:inosine/xanthosine triphosphate pyrophosphatase family protein
MAVSNTRISRCDKSYQHASHNAQQALLLVQDTNLHTHGLHGETGGLSNELAYLSNTRTQDNTK